MPKYLIPLSDGTEIIVDANSLEEAYAKAETIVAEEDAGIAPAEEMAGGQPRGLLREVGRQFGLTGRYVAEGVAGAVGMVTDPLAQATATLTGQPEQFVPLRQLAGEGMTALGAPQPETPFERVVGEASRGVAGAAVPLGAAQRVAGMVAPGVARMVPSAARTPVQATPRPVATAVAAQPASQLAAGAGAGGAGQAAAEAGLPQEAQFGAAIAGGLAGGMVGQTRAPVQAPQLPADLAAARARGIDVMTSDVIPPRTFVGRTAQAMGERIPVTGTGPLRERQQTQRVTAVRALLAEFGAEDAAGASDNVMKDLLAKRAAELEKYTKQKKEVIERLGNAGGVVPLPRTIAAIDAEIAKLRSQNMGGQLQNVIDTLQTWKRGLQNQGLLNIEANRQLIGEAFTSPLDAPIRSVAQKALNKIYNPLREEMGEFIKRTGLPADFNKWQVANKRLQQMAPEIKDQATASILRRGEATPELIDRLLFSKRPSEVATLYRMLTPEGRAHARAAVLFRAAERSSMAEPLAGRTYSPERFANEVKRMGASVGVLFDPDDVKQIEGLMRVLEITKRAGETAATPPTGVQLAIPAGVTAVGQFFGAGLEGFLATMGAMATVGGMARVYESAPVRDILIKIPQTVAGSPEEAALIKRLAIAVATERARQSVQEEERQPLEIDITEGTAP